LSSYPGRAPALSFRTVLRTFGQDGATPLSALLSAEDIDLACREEGVRFAPASHHVWTPALTVWALLSQCLSDSKSCVAAVARALTLRVGLGLPPCAAATGAYCKARAKLPVPLLRRLATRVGGELERQAPPGWRWKGRRVLLADGTTASGPDTPANQAEYPQPGTQKPGLGFPLIRLVVLLGFATAALVDAAIGPWSGKRNGEMALLRQLLGSILANDVLVADRASCSYWLLAELRRRGADGAFRLHQSRHYDFGKGRQLGRDDHVVVWSRPARPAWMDRETYLAVPKQLEVREVRFRVDRPGYRSREILVATTLLDAGQYSKDDLAELYGHRWRVELDIRDVKQTLKMDVLRGRTPEMLRREIWAHLLAYNLTRQVAAQAALRAGLPPRRVSFAGAKQALDAFRAALQGGEGDSWGRQVEAMLTAVAAHRVGHRNGRFEPRQVKRRAKVFPMMTRPRSVARAALVTAGVEETSE
jgi:DDE family transposase